MDKEAITVVSGLPRSGTSMLMKMLESGGIEPLTDKIRTADSDNPKGYYEFERVKKLPEDTVWLEDARGKVVKVLAELIKELPNDYSYRVIFIQRNIGEMIESQKKMLIRRGEDTDKISDDELKILLEKYLRIIKHYVDNQSNMKVLYVNFNEIMQDPVESVKEINRFCGGTLDEEKMISIVDKDLYRNRMDDG